MSRAMKHDADLIGLGRFIRERRRTLGLTQQQLAERVGWVQERISLLETAKYGTPSIAGLAGLADALEVPQATLLQAAGYLEAAGSLAGEEGQRVAQALPRPIDPGNRQEEIVTLSREGARLFDQVATLQYQLHTVQERIEMVDQLRSQMVRTRRQMQVLTAALHGSGLAKSHPSRGDQQA